MSAQIEPCTTSSANRRHYSANLRAPDPKYGSEGRWGQTLCGTGAIDEKEANRHQGTIWGRRFPVVVADLQECRLCAKSRAKRLGEPDPTGGAT